MYTGVRPPAESNSGRQATGVRVADRPARWGRAVIFGLVVLLHPTRVSVGVVVGALDLNSNPVDVVRARLYNNNK